MGGLGMMVNMVIILNGVEMVVVLQTMVMAMMGS